MTREEFEEWTESVRAEALDGMPQSDASVQRWLARYNHALRVLAEELGEEDEDDEDEDDEDDEDDPEAEL